MLYYVQIDEVRAGSRPRQVRLRPKAPPKKKKKIPVEKKAPLFIIKGPNFYKIIYIFKRLYIFFLLVMYKFYYWLTNYHVINNKKCDINIH